MVRQRIEDLGRIAVLSDNLLEHDFFAKFEETGCRAKDFLDWFLSKDQEFREDFIHSYGYWVQGISEKVYEIREIARGEDLLNENDGNC
jgi:hypothetical protein